MGGREPSLRLQGSIHAVLWNKYLILLVSFKFKKISWN